MPTVGFQRRVKGPHQVCLGVVLLVLVLVALSTSLVLIPVMPRESLSTQRLLIGAVLCCIAARAVHFFEWQATA
jgi:hypothetical protein